MGSFIFPCPSTSGVSSPYGYRKCPYHGDEHHNGVDLGAVTGAAILAARAGTVTTAAYDSGFGNFLAIDHGNAIVTRYAHASKLLVSKGDMVAAGQKIALVGSTGLSTGSHLHFEIIVNSIYKNPLTFVSMNDTAANFTGVKGVSSSSSNSGTPDITKTSVKSTYGSAGTYKFTELIKNNSGTDASGFSILIENDKIYKPVIVNDVTLTYERKDSPGCLKFSVLKNGDINFTEGNPVGFQINGDKIFYGYIFSKCRNDNDTISVTAYDQLRYLKNKDTVVYSGKKYSELVKMVAGEYGLVCGDIEDTGYIIPQRIEEGTLFDILYNAADLTALNNGNLFVLYDDYGKICLKNEKNMIVPVLINDKSACGFSYSSSIDGDVFNRVKLSKDNKDSGEREVYIFNDSKNQASWGILQHYERMAGSESEDISLIGNNMLERFNIKKRTLSLSDCFGDIRLRGGSSVCVNMDLGDLLINKYMMVERVVHKFSKGGHFMDIDMLGV